MPSDSDRRFNKGEIQEIFRRAAERQAEKRESEDGLTLGELQQIGEESGIAPEHIAAAVQEFDRPDDSALHAPPEPTIAPQGLERFYGMNASARFERRLPGRVDGSAWEDIVEVLESTFQNRGKATTAGRLREWYLASAFGFDMRVFGPDAGVADWLKIFDSMSEPTKGPITVELCPDDEDTRIEMTYAMPTRRLWEGPGFVGLFLAIAAVVLGVFGVVGEPMILIAPLVLLLLAVVVGGSVRGAHRNEIKETKKRMRKAVKRVEQIQAARHAEQSGRTRTGTSTNTSRQRAATANGAEAQAENESAGINPLRRAAEEPAAEETALNRQKQRSRA